MRAPSERQQDAEWQRGDHAGDGHDESDQQSPPIRRLDWFKPEIEAEQGEHDRDAGEHDGEGTTRTANRLARHPGKHPHGEQQQRRQDCVVEREAKRRRRHDGAKKQAALVADMPTGQQDEGGDRKDDEQIEGVQAFVGDARDQHRDQPDDQHQEHEVDAPALVDRIASIDELRQIGLHIGPAGAGRLHAGLPVGAFPGGVDQREADEGRQRPGDECQQDDRRDAVQGGGEQVLPEPSEDADGASRRRLRLQDRGADIALAVWCVHGAALTARSARRAC